MRARAGAAFRRRRAPNGGPPLLAISLVATLLALVGILGATACAAVEAAPIGGPTRQGEAADSTTAMLFTPAVATGIPDRTGEPNVVRSRLVGVELAVLAPGGNPAAGPERVVLNLFDDAMPVAVRERVEPAAGGYVWVGRVEGAQHGEVMLAVGDGVMMGNIRADDATFQVRFAGSGAHTVSQLDAGGYAPD